MRFLLLVLLLAAALALGTLVYQRLQEGSATEGTSPESRAAAPVEVAPITRGTIHLRRTFSGALEAAAEFVVAPKVGGRLQRLMVDVGDPVRRGQVVASLDNAEYLQALAQAQADLAVAEANASEAESALEIAERALQRIVSLRGDNVASELEYDVAKSDEIARRAELAVSEAQVKRATASLETAKIRLGYTEVTVEWIGGDEQRFVAERFVDEGDMLAVNTPLLSIVELDPISAVMFVPERDYARLEIGQEAKLTTDAFLGKDFEGKVERIAPVFRQSTRQARVELIVANPGQRLKPGMFIRATLILDRVSNATIVPYAALTERDDRTGVFLVDPSGSSVQWREVIEGIRDGDLVQVSGKDLEGRVVTLGQQLCDDGSPITIPGEIQEASP